MMSKIKKGLYKGIELIIGNVIINKIPSRSVRRWYYELMGSTIGKNTVIYRRAEVNQPNHLNIGDNTSVGYYCLLDARGGIDIGNNVNISSYSKLITGSHDVNDGANFSAVFKPITVKDYAWICTNALILQGVTIGKGAVVAAGAVVTKDIPDYTIWGGCPAKQIGIRNNNLTYISPKAHALK